MLNEHPQFLSVFIILRKILLMCFLHFFKALMSCFPVAYKRMDKKSVESCFLVTVSACLNGKILILLDYTHKTDDMLVINLAYGNGLCAVLSDNSGNLDYIVGLKEGKSIAVFDIYNLNVIDIIGDCVDKIYGNKGILVAASLVKKCGLNVKSLV